MLVLWYGSVVTLIATTGGDFEQRRDRRVGDVVDSVSIPLIFLLFQYGLLNCFALLF